MSSTDLVWIKAQSSNTNGSACVELSRDGDDFLIRNSRFPETGPLPPFTPAEMEAFILAAKAGEFDDLVWPAQIAH
jgi:hypothetical protein